MLFSRRVPQRRIDLYRTEVSCSRAVMAARRHDVAVMLPTLVADAALGLRSHSAGGDFCLLDMGAHNHISTQRVRRTWAMRWLLRSLSPRRPSRMTLLPLMRGEINGVCAAPCSLDAFPGDDLICTHQRIPHLKCHTGEAGKTHEWEVDDGFDREGAG